MDFLAFWSQRSESKVPQGGFLPRPLPLAVAEHFLPVSSHAFFVSQPWCPPLSHMDTRPLG